MSKKELIERTIHTLEKLPEEKIVEVSDFADYIFQKNEPLTQFAAMPADI